jgi:adenylate cyclase
MAAEIERKFLVRDQHWQQWDRGEHLCQGYLSRDPRATVRVRITGSNAFLTVKGKSEGITRAEFEYAVPLADAKQMLALCDGPLIEKIRYRIPYGAHVFEVDVFAGDNAGLTVAEVELTRADEIIELPPWIVREVSDDPRYFNSNLARNPYCLWRDNK